MSDPVDIVADALARYWPELKDRGQRQWIAGDVLRQLVEDGWRIVRQRDGETEMDDDPDSPTYGEHVTVAVIEAEWSIENDENLEGQET